MLFHMWDVNIMWYTSMTTVLFIRLFGIQWVIFYLMVSEWLAEKKAPIFRIAFQFFKEKCLTLCWTK